MSRTAAPAGEVTRAIRPGIRGIGFLWAASKKPRHEARLKFSYKEQREYETIDQDIEALERQAEELDAEIEKASTQYTRLEELTRKKEEVQKALEEKMERWVYLSELAEKIESAKNI